MHIFQFFVLNLTDGIVSKILSALGSVMPAVYSLAGVLVGGWISRQSQHRQWVHDNKAREYRELLDGLFTSTERILKARPTAETQITDSLADAVWEGTRLTQNRIFILRAIQGEGIDKDWQKISNVALWNPGELKIKVEDKEWGYTQGIIIILRKDLETKILALTQKDLRL